MIWNDILDTVVDTSEEVKDCMHRTSVGNKSEIISSKSKTRLVNADNSKSLKEALVRKPD